jgi:hypothetical protein
LIAAVEVNISDDEELARIDLTVLTKGEIYSAAACT